MKTIDESRERATVKPGRVPDETCSEKPRNVVESWSWKKEKKHSEKNWRTQWKQKKSGDAGGDQCLGQMRSAHWKRIKKKDIEQSKNPVLNSVKRRAETNNNQKKKEQPLKKGGPRYRRKRKWPSIGKKKQPLINLAPLRQQQNSVKLGTNRSN